MPIELGHRLSTTGEDSGPPITIGWKHVATRSTSVEVYELLKVDETRRRGEELRLTARDRSAILWRMGYAIDEIVRASISNQAEGPVKKNRDQEFLRSSHIVENRQLLLKWSSRCVPKLDRAGCFAISGRRRDQPSGPASKNGSNPSFRTCRIGVNADIFQGTRRALLPQ
jgi:hypothetical protein